MSKPAARVGDPHACSSASPAPHVGGPILPTGMGTVLIGGVAAARMGDLAACSGPTDVITEGVACILIGGQPAARVGCRTGHGGELVSGCPTVLLGGPSIQGGGTPQHKTLSKAKASAAALAGKGCNKKK